MNKELQKVEGVSGFLLKEYAICLSYLPMNLT